MNAIQMKIENLLNAPINLENYCDSKNLNPPNYEYQKDIPENQHRKFYKCSIEIDGQSYHGQDISKRLAKCRAALDAINNLKIEDDNNNNNDIPPSYDEQIDNKTTTTVTASDEDDENDNQVEDEEEEEEDEEIEEEGEESEQDSDENDNVK